MKDLAIRLIELLDHAVIHVEHRLVRERTGVLIFAFHTVFKDQAELDRNDILPQQGFTVERYRRFFDLFLEAGYGFVSVDDLASGLDGSGKQIMLTIDDGYYNTHRILPLLEEYQAPACWFISTAHVEQQKAYWWDVLYRHAMSKGISFGEYGNWVKRLKRMKTRDAEAFVKKECGEECLKPVSDLDRPATVGELKDIAAHPLMYIGNHTRDHAILTNYSLAEAQMQVAEAQENLLAWTGARPEIFAYPNGNFSTSHFKLLDELSFKYALSSEFANNPLPLPRSGDGRFRLGRFAYSSGEQIEEHSLRFRSRFSPYVWSVYWKQKLAAALRAHRE